MEPEGLPESDTDLVGDTPLDAVVEIVVVRTAVIVPEGGAVKDCVPVAKLVAAGETVCVDETTTVGLPRGVVEGVNETEVVRETKADALIDADCAAVRDTIDEADNDAVTDGDCDVPDVRLDVRLAREDRETVIEAVNVDTLEAEYVAETQMVADRDMVAAYDAKVETESNPDESGDDDDDGEEDGEIEIKGVADTLGDAVSVTDIFDDALLVVDQLAVRDDVVDWDAVAVVVKDRDTTPEREGVLDTLTIAVAVFVADSEDAEEAEFEAVDVTDEVEDCVLVTTDDCEGELLVVGDFSGESEMLGPPL